MSFRDEGEKAYEWKRWVEGRRDDIRRCGLPDSLMQTRFHWLRFLEVAYDEWTGWSPSMLSREQAQALHEFIVREYGNSQYRGCLYAIEKILARGEG